MKLNILFLLYRAKVNSTGKCPVRCRITLNKIRKEFSTGQFVTPQNWDSKKQLVKPPEPDRNTINTELSLIKTKLNKAFLLLQIKEESLNVDDIYSLYKGKKLIKEYNVVQYLRGIIW
jgi:hypothetical protein